MFKVTYIILIILIINFCKQIFVVISAVEDIGRSAAVPASMMPVPINQDVL